jgi:hypothetical protein
MILHDLLSAFDFLLLAFGFLLLRGMRCCYEMKLNYLNTTWICLGSWLLILDTHYAILTTHYSGQLL